ncbi:TPA: hypothetical protein ACT9IY_000143 [Legionella pneumophila]|nr:hypothetical protein [Legionella pneumophila]
MSLDFNIFIDIEHHYEKIQRHAQVIRNKYAPIADTAQYLHALFDFFLDDIKNIANEIYNGALDEANKGCISFSALEVKECIINGTKACFDLYMRLINGYNAGAMFRGYDKLEKDIDCFKLRMHQISQKQSESIYSKYSTFLKKERRETWNSRATIIAAVMSTLGVIIAIGVSFAPSLKTVSTKPHLESNAKIDNILISATQLAVNRCNIPKK